MKGIPADDPLAKAAELAQTLIVFETLGTELVFQRGAVTFITKVRIIWDRKRES